MFNYPEVVGNPFLYHHTMNDHNNRQHSLISLEVVWTTKYWPNHVFAFLLSITEINVTLATTYFCEQQQMSQIKFQKLLDKTLIYKNHYNEEIDNMPDKSGKVGDQPLSHHAPHTKFFLGHILSPQTVHLHNTSAQPDRKGTYLLSLFPRYLLVCRMLWASPCLF